MLATLAKGPQMIEALMLLLVPPTVRVVSPAPARPKYCPLQVYRSIGQIPEPYRPLCWIGLTSEVSFPLVNEDQTGKAVAKAREEACKCGGSGILILSNSSDSRKPELRAVTRPTFGGRRTEFHDFRPSETVEAMAISFEGVAPPPQEHGTASKSLKPGFRDLLWGAKLTETFQQIPDGDYIRPGDALKVADLPVKSISYSFDDGQLFRVFVVFEAASLEAVVRHLRGAWGSPTGCSSGEGGRSCGWGNTATGDESTEAIAWEDPKGPAIVLTIQNRERVDKATKKAKTKDSGL